MSPPPRRRKSGSTRLSSKDDKRRAAAEQAADNGNPAAPFHSFRGFSFASRRHQAPLDLDVDHRSASTFLFTYLTDPSAIGIFVASPAPHPPGTPVFLRFQSPDSRPLEVEGRVIWINRPRGPLSGGPQEGDPGMGVQFVDLTVFERERIFHLVRTLAYLNDEQDYITGNS